MNLLLNLLWSDPVAQTLIILTSVCALFLVLGLLAESLERICRRIRG